VLLEGLYYFAGHSLPWSGEDGGVEPETIAFPSQQQIHQLRIWQYQPRRRLMDTWAKDNRLYG
jgi:hypothetical protein